MKCWIFFWFLSLIISKNIYADTPRVSIQKISESQEWHRLLHLKNSLPFGLKKKSEVDNEDFFIADDGKSNPLSELEATIKAMSNPNHIHVGKMKQHAQCAFPARKKFLKRWFDFPKVECSELNTWKKDLNVKSVYLVFSTAYPNNPASSFGHTFLRLKMSDERSDLLDYAINFAADTEGVENGFSYTILGVLGGFKGFFTLEKYYLKINEYNNSESRDLWEYEINLTPDQVETLLLHYWELYTNGYMKYFFMDENCSYHLLTIIEVANPEWNLTDAFHHPGVLSFTLPADTVKEIIKNKNAVRSIEFRPSKRKILYQKIEALDKNETEDFFKLIKNPDLVNGIKNSFVIDAAIEYFDYKKREEKTPKPETQEKLRKLLVARSQMGSAQVRELPPIDKTNQPEKSHGSSSIGLLSGVRNDYGVFGFKYKMGLHDLLNTDDGYDLFSQIDFLNFQFVYSEKTKTFLFDEFKFMDISSMMPLDRLEKKFSWRVLIQSESLKNSLCDSCHKHFIYGGFGATVDFLNKRGMFAAFIIAQAQYSDDLAKEFQIGPGLEGQFLYKINSHFKTKISALFFENLNERSKSRTYDYYELQLAYEINKSWDIRAINRFAPRNDDSVTDDYYSHFLIQHTY